MDSVKKAAAASQMGNAPATTLTLVVAAMAVTMAVEQSSRIQIPQIQSSLKVNVTEYVFTIFCYNSRFITLKVFKNYITQSNIILLNKENQYCAYNIETYNLYSFPKYTYHVLTDFFGHNNYASIKEKYGIDISELQEVLAKIGYRSNYILAKKDKVCNKKRIIKRITLHIANDCNLRCKYCYADGGSYAHERNLMDKNTAIQFVDYCCQNYKYVENVVFFGGEPFLNYKIMELVYELFNQRYQQGLISKVPRFGAITNGTILNQTILKIIKKYFSFITVSADGPEEIHNCNRIRVDKKGSFKYVDKFLNTISTIENLNIGIEATFTRQHIEGGYTHESIRKFFQDQYNLLVDVVDEIAIDKENMDNEEMSNPFESAWFSNILSTLIRKSPETKCDIVWSMLAISTEGDIYPCHMNIGDKMKPIASIWQNGSIVSECLNNGDEYLLKNNATCDMCWANNFCGGCSRSWFYDIDRNTYSSKPNNNRCEKFRNITASALLKICEIRRNNTLWRELLKNLNITSDNVV